MRNESGMNPNKRSKMTRQERAKQFMPFAALKGYEEALRKVEKELESSLIKQPDNKDNGENE